MQVRRKIVFYGKVQGVGFRFRARCHAQELGLTGWVENCWDGSVRMEVQGSADAIGTLLLRMRRERFVNIERYEAEAAPCRDERHFEIR